MTDQEIIDEAMRRIELRRDAGNFSAYYFDLEPTGDPAIDLILAAIADAGKSYHHTGDWADEDHGPSCVYLIQEAACRAAERDKADGQRLDRIAEIIEQVELRCDMGDGPVTPTMQEMTQDEISRIYALSKRKPEEWRPNSEGKEDGTDNN